jgi:hypothetical protein
MISVVPETGKDVRADTRIDKSNLYSILSPETTLQMKITQPLLRRLLGSRGWIQFFVVLVPNGMDENKIVSVNNAVSQGARVIADPMLMSQTKQ